MMIVQKQRLGLLMIVIAGIGLLLLLVVPSILAPTPAPLWQSEPIAITALPKPVAAQKPAPLAPPTPLAPPAPVAAAPAAAPTNADSDSLASPVSAPVVP